MISQETIMGLIVNGGNARSCVMEAIEAARKNEFEKASQKISEAEDFLNAAHSLQTACLTEEAKGNTQSISLLMVHAQDHLMTALSMKDMAKQMIKMYEKFNPLCE